VCSGVCVVGVQFIAIAVPVFQGDMCHLFLSCDTTLMCWFVVDQSQALGIF